MAPLLARGAGIAVAVTIAAEIIGTVIGLFVALARLYGGWWLRAPALVYVDMIRGTPMLVQIFLVYFGLPGLYQSLTGNPFNPGLWVDENLPAMTSFFARFAGEGFSAGGWFSDNFVFIAGVLALGLNSGAYVSEVYRTAIGSIDKGQSEAARALGLSRRQTMRFVVLPQAFRWAIPPLGNEFITLLKDTSLLSVIGVAEITQQGQLYMSRTYAAFPAFLGVALTYLVLTLTISFLLRRLEGRLRVP